MNLLRSFAIALMCAGVSGSAVAEDRGSIGWGSLFNNDALGDGKDRWRTASLVVSHVRGDDWTGHRPDRIGALVEYRFRAEIIAPVSVEVPKASDRRYVGALSFGAHTHFQRGASQMSLGLDLTFVGPQTGVDQFQDSLHGLFASASVNVDGFQLSNAVYPTITFEAGREFEVGGVGRARPYVELQVGAETLARVGADLTFGGYGRGALMLRDNPTGQLYAGVAGDRPLGFSMVLGGDVAYVADSQYLDTPGIVKADVRGRLRAGVHQQFRIGALFYGATYLSKEYEAQSEGQVVGSLSAKLKF